jgi:hypothetical protein
MLRNTPFFIALLLFASIGFGQNEPVKEQPAKQSPSKGGAPQNPSPMVEHTRAHPRLPKAAPAGRSEQLSLGTLYIPANLKLKSPTPVLFFFHAPDAVPEIAAAKHKMVAVNIRIGAGSSTYAKPFKDSEFFGHLLQEAEQKAGVQLRPITLGGWSAGCGAIRQIMSTPQYYDEIQNIIAIDGIHTSYVNGTPGPLESDIDPEPLQIFIKLARDAMAGKKHVLYTHTEIFPGTFASTTETADYILKQLGLHAMPVVKWGPMGTQELSETRSGKFLMVGFAGNSAPDHVDQLESLPTFLNWIK